MYKLATCLLAATLTAGTLLPTTAAAQHRRAPPPRHHHGFHRSYSHGWSTTGKILTGVALGSILLNSYQPAPPPRREVVTYSSVYYPPYVPTVQEVRVVQPAPVTVIQRPTLPAYPVAETIWVQNSNGSETPVELRRDGSGRYIGPKGEYYQSRPSNEQLRLLYGL